MLQQGHIRLSVGQIQQLKWGREEKMVEKECQRPRQMWFWTFFCLFANYSFFIFYYNRHWSFTLVSQSHRYICLSQYWLLSLLLAGPLERSPPLLFFFWPSCSLMKQLFMILNFSGCGQVCFGLVHHQAQMFKPDRITPRAIDYA